MKVKITDGNITRIGEYSRPQKLSKILSDFELYKENPCGGKGTCGKCSVRAYGALSEASDKERELLGKDFFVGKRLSCVCEAIGDCEIILESRKNKIETELFERSYKHIPEPGFGVAVDIGTTTVVVYLYALGNGKKIGVTSFLNPQGIYGSDVISRITAAMEGKLEHLSAIIKKLLSDAIGKLFAANGVPLSELKKIVICGNTAMMYLFTGRSPASISRAPFETECFFGEYYDARQLGFDKSVNVYIVRSVSAYIGGDITAAATAVRLADNTDDGLLLDIGTNGECVLSVDGKLTCASAAAGPCFEGVGIRCGMMAKSGAISRVNIQDGKIVYETVNNAPPSGICGSGLIDAVKVMLELGIIDESGYFNDDDGVFYIGDSGIYIDDRDIRNIQLAKSAICSCVRTLLYQAGVERVRTLYFAGGFGSCIDPESAAFIGLIPKNISDETVRVGNAAGYGATLILLSEDEKHYSEDLAKKAKTVDLSTNPYFNRQFIENMCFNN